MRVTAFTRRVLAYRREQRDMLRAGWERIEPRWTMLRGCRTGERVIEARPSVDGKSIWYRTDATGVNR